VKAFRKGRRGGQPPAGDQGYLASVSDLMAVLFFLVMIILAVFTVNTLEQFRQKEKDLSDRQAEMDKLDREKEEALAALSRIRNELLDAREVRAGFLGYIKEEMDRRKISITIEPNEGIFRFPENVLFASGAYELNDDGRAALAALGSILSGRLPCYAGPRNSFPPPECRDRDLFKPGRFDVILIEGHTDNVPLGRTHKLKDNMQLSSYRSWATYTYLIENFKILDDLTNSDGQFLVGTSGYGEKRGAVSNDLEEGRSLNRRVDFRIVLAAPSPDSIPEMSSASSSSQFPAPSASPLPDSAPERRGSELASLQNQDRLIWQPPNDAPDRMAYP
jgi:flagellar motor protein MotB